MTPLSGPVVTAAEMRAAEDAVIAGGVSVEALMERAGAAVAEAVWRFGGGRSVLILCGPGNNGGDGYVAARLLAERGLDVRVAACAEPRTDACRWPRQGWTGAVATLEDAEGAPVLVDALFGTGLSRPLDEAVQAPLRRLAAEARLVIAVDVPSGVGTDDGRSLGAAQASFTLALGALKPAHLLYPAAGLCGIVQRGEIGVPISSTTQVMAPPRLASPGATSHKFKRGMVAVIGGAMPGAARLSAQAAMRCAGYVVAANMAGRGPDALVHRDWASIASDDRIGALLIGPGLGRDETARTALQAALESIHPLVLDADALVLLTAEHRLALRRRSTPVIMTPHSGEFDAMFGAGSGSKIDRARAAAAECGAVIVFKGADTVVAAPDGRVRLSSDAPGWLASAGTGDVLAGIAAGCLSGGMAPLDAACAAVWLHGEAARVAGPALIADDLPDCLPQAIARAL